MANWKLACGKQTFFSRRVNKEPKKASAPRRLTGNAQSLILYPRKGVLAEVILRHEFNTLLCLCCSFVIGLPVAKNSEATSKKDEMANGSPRRHCVTHSSSSGPIF